MDHHCPEREVSALGGKQKIPWLYVAGTTTMCPLERCPLREVKTYSFYVAGTKTKCPPMGGVLHSAIYLSGEHDELW